MKIQSDVREARCPACGTWINTTGLTRRRKVQCPKCREVVDLSTAEVASGRTGPEPPAVPPELAADLAELRARVERVETLEARVLALERALERAGRIAPDSAPTPGKLKWVPHSETFREAGFNDESANILVHNLSAVRPHTIALRSAAGDPSAKDRALCFKDLFERGNWIVRGPWDTYAPIGERGLILAVRSFPVPAEATAAFIALTASGFSVISRLDPNLDSDEAMLIVA